MISITLQNKFKVAAALTLVLSAAACGGGSDAPALPPAPAPAPTPTPTPVSISEIKACSMTGVGAAVLSTDAPTTILDAVPGTIGSVSYCLVKVVVAQAVNIWVTLPMGGAWNGDLRSQGGGVFAGSVAAETAAAAAGYIGVQTDTGHSGFFLSGAFAMLSPGVPNVQLQEDFAFRSEHLMAVVAKQLARVFYGQEPNTSFWYGCSTGGRQGMMMAQRYPEDYDGILAGAPAIHWDRFQAQQIWPQVVMRQDLGYVLSPAKQTLATNAAIASCDAADGVTDGLLNDPRQCTYNPVSDTTITKDTCTQGDNTCLTRTEAGVMQKIWGGARNASGIQLWPGTERGATTLPMAGAAPFAAATEQGKYFVYLDPNWDWTTLTYANYGAFFDKTVAMVGPVLGTDNPDLSAFKAHGGKLINYHGWADPLIMPQGTTQYYEAMNSKLGGAAAVDTFARLFMVPGMGHCGGGDGPNAFGQDGVPKADADHDAFKALVKWVKEGTAPDQVIATKYTGDDPTQAVLRTRPLCVYPKVAKYKGSGSSDDAANFSCEAP